MRESSIAARHRLTTWHLNIQVEDFNGGSEEDLSGDDRSGMHATFTSPWNRDILHVHCQHSVTLVCLVRKLIQWNFLVDSLHEAQ